MSLSDSSSLVLLWAEGSIHKSPRARRYLKLLDLKAGMDLHARCDRVWPHYTEVIKNRKQCILELVMHDALTGIKQVVIFGSGMDALSLEIASAVEDEIVYEVDESGMDLKRELINQANADPDGAVRLVTADLCDVKSVVNRMRKAGWNSNEPSILIFEGVSYFLPERSLWDLIAAFSTEGGRNRLVLEYLLGENQISAGRAAISGRVFDIILESAGILDAPPVTRYDENGIRRRLGVLGGRIIHRYGMREMEKERTGENAYFGEDGSWWIEISHAAV